MVVGVGANLAYAPALPDRPTTSLAALGTRRTVSDMATALSAHFATWLGEWRREGLAAVRAAWLARAHPIGTPLEADVGEGRRVAGVFAGLRDDCALVLRLPDGATRVIHAGDIFLR